MAPFPRRERLFTAPLDPTGPIALLKDHPLPPGAVLARLTIDRVYLQYHHGPVKEYTPPKAMQGFHALTLKDDPSVTGRLTYLGRWCVDPSARDRQGTVSDLAVRLLYDPLQDVLEGVLTPSYTSPLPEASSPLQGVLVGFCVHYTPGPP